MSDAPGGVNGLPPEAACSFWNSLNAAAISAADLGVFFVIAVELPTIMLALPMLGGCCTASVSEPLPSNVMVPTSICGVDVGIALLH
jgi:hypothetical protein